MDAGFPKLIADAWNGIPDGMDAAFSLNNIGKSRKTVCGGTWKALSSDKVCECIHTKRTHVHEERIAFSKQSTYVVKTIYL